MTGITVSADSLAAILATPVAADRFASVDTVARRLIRTAYSGDIDAATGRALDVLESVYTSICLRLLTNPTGALTLGIGTASVGFGASDDTTQPLTLTSQERADLASLKPTKRPSFVTFRKLNFAEYQEPLYRRVLDEETM